MSTILFTLIAAVVVVLVMMAGLGIKMLMKKSHEFKRPCTNADPRTGRCANCTCKKKRSTVTA
ncbi:MAG: hypothetical protein IJ620_00560 [Bacteroidales bacterium]|nr:hypothetical protein [Bacteroidales bacterium]